MIENALKAEIIAVMTEQIGKPFVRAWMGCVSDRGSVNRRLRFQPSMGRDTYCGFMTSIPAGLRIGEIVKIVCRDWELAQRSPCNSVTFILEYERTLRCDYSFRDVVKTGWGPIFEE